MKSRMVFHSLLAVGMVVAAMAFQIVSRL